MTNQQSDTNLAAESSTSGVLVLTQRVAAPPEAVFPFLVEPDQMLRWFGTEADIEPVPGGKFCVNVNGTDVAVGEYTEVDPPRRVVFTWGWDGSTDVPPGSTTVTITLTADGDDTVVELRHEGLSGEAADAHSGGWSHYLPLLAQTVGAVETVGVPPDVDARSTHR